MSKFTIYQVFPRHFGNDKTLNKHYGSIEENGCGKFNSFTTKALNEIKTLGITHIWYTGIIEHATQTDYTTYGIKKDHDEIVKGKAGSPYAIKDYYDVDPDLAQNIPNRMMEFEKLITRTHKAGMKVIIDFVPNHVAREYFSDSKPVGITDLGEEDHPEWAFSPLNNFYYIPNQPFTPQFPLENYVEYPAKVTGNDQFTPSPTRYDWYETVKLNYGVNYAEGSQKQFEPIPNTWLKMKEILEFWAEKGVDGFRCDMAEMVPTEFWGWAIQAIKIKFPMIIFIAEVYNQCNYQEYIETGKFDFLYNKSGLYETLRNTTSRSGLASEITSAWQSVDKIQDKMLNFLENHDEQRIASGFFCGNGIYAQPAMIIATTLTKGPVMIYSGQELGEEAMNAEGFSGLDGRTSIFDYWGIKTIQEWRNKGKFDGERLSDERKNIQSFYKKLLNISITEKAIKEGIMYDLEYANFDNPQFNTHKQFAFFRKWKNELILVVVNFHDKELNTTINIPTEAIQYLGIKKETKYQLVNLLDENEKLTDWIVSDKNAYTTKVHAWKGKILKLKKEHK